MLVVDYSIRVCWKLGRVVEVYPSRDKKIRSVKLLLGDRDLKDKYLVRPVHKLVSILEVV